MTAGSDSLAAAIMARAVVRRKRREEIDDHDMAVLVAAACHDLREYDWAIIDHYDVARATRDAANMRERGKRYVLRRAGRRWKVERAKEEVLG